MPPWFEKCKKVPWQPPGIVFRIVWPILYVLYITVILLERKNPNTLFILLLGLAMNLCWVPLFIYNTRLALVLLAAMIIVGIKTMSVLDAADKNNNNKGLRRRTFLFAPYLGWISFAFTLNAYLAISCV
jgi:tryptophan-rich sensory protein